MSYIIGLTNKQYHVELNREVEGQH